MILSKNLCVFVTLGVNAYYRAVTKSIELHRTAYIAISINIKDIQ